ncbi:MAG TPA: rhodanese-like domain-containing protein [Thermoanaerobaculia bacterium]|nr:rhodanese-like domain-containing protein [Thermoanaerobaculia bacterium]
MQIDTETARRHFAAKLELETDPADVFEALRAGDPSIVVIDARKPDSYARAHVPGAINIPWRTMDADSTQSLSRGKTYVTYCDGTGCNASTKAALRLSELGFRVKELVGGLDWWTRVDGYPVIVGTQAGTLNANAAIACDC